MYEPRRHDGSRVAVHAGPWIAGSVRIGGGRDILAGGPDLWRGERLSALLTPEGWSARPDLLRAYYDENRIAAAQLMPSVSHNALARLQHALGLERCTLFTESIDGLIQKASAPDVIEMHGSLFRLRCERDRDHPQLGVFGAQNPSRRCSACGAALRPDVVWPGEEPYGVDRMREAVSHCDVFLSVGSPDEALGAELLALARTAKAWCIEVESVPAPGREPSGYAGFPASGVPSWRDSSPTAGHRPATSVSRSGDLPHDRSLERELPPTAGTAAGATPRSREFDEVVDDPSERALHRVIGRWLNEEPTEYP